MNDKYVLSDDRFWIINDGFVEYVTVFISDVPKWFKTKADEHGIYVEMEDGAKLYALENN